MYKLPIIANIHKLSGTYSSTVKNGLLFSRTFKTLKIKKTKNFQGQWEACSPVCKVSVSVNSV